MTSEKQSSLSPEQFEPFTKIPTELVGKLLDQGKASAAAVHLIALKLSRGPSFVLNNHYARRFGISERAFRGGLRILNKSILERRQTGRCQFATERLRPHRGEPFICLPDRLLLSPSDVLAFIVAVNLSPHPSRPTVIGRRIGHRSPKTVRRLVAAASKEIAIYSAPGFPTYVARKGYVFPFACTVGKNDLGKNGPGKIDTTHTRGKVGTAEEREATEKHKRIDHTRSSERGRSKQENDAVLRSDPRSLVLTDWRATEYIRGLELPRPNVTPILSMKQWRGHLEAFGGAPSHLATPASYRQALDISHTLGERYERWPPYIMAALASAICAAHAGGKRIRSLAFIVERFLRRAEREDLSWVDDRPSHLEAKSYAEAHELALAVTAALERVGFPIKQHTLLTTAAVEQLHYLMRHFGLEATRIGLQGARRPAEGKVVVCWSWFRPEIEAAARKGSGG